MTKNEENNTAGIFFTLFLVKKIAIYLSLGLYKGRPSNRRSLQPSKKKSSTTKNEISMFVGHFCHPGFGYRSRDPIESGSNPDPDPRH
jgi:hypothetical protein